MKKNIKFLFVVILILTTVKAFTAILRHKNDPTVSIAVKWNPSSENVVIQYGCQRGYIILFSDENETFGESTLSLIYEVPLLIYFLILICILLYMKKKKH